MRLTSPRVMPYGRRVLYALAFLCAVSTTVLAQFGGFDPSFDGELWGVRHEITIADNGVPAGVAFSGGRLFVADSAHQTVIAYDAAGQIVAIPGADWDTTDPLSPVFGLTPNQLTAIVVDVDGTDRSALLISDSDSNRAAAFDAADGSYLFTLRLQRPFAAPTLTLSVGQMAMSSGARFHLATGPSVLTLSGSFAAAWREQETIGTVHSGVLAYLGASSVFPRVGTEFVATPTAVLTGTEDNLAAPEPQNMFGVTFDTEGNLYAMDAYTERLHVYSPLFTRLFTFGTPVAGGGTAEFSEPWGLAFWPDAAGTSGRILINDTYNSRIMIYRPVDGADLDDVIDGLQFETAIANFVAPDPPIELFAIAVEPSTGTIAVSDFAELTENAVPRVVVLQKPRLAAFNLQLLDEDDQAISSVCAATGFKIRFSLTVPAGLAPVDNVAPRLLIDGVPTGVVPDPAAVYPSTTLSAGEVMTFTYAFPGISDDIDVLAGATASNTNDIMSRAQTVFVADCAAETDPTTFDIAPSIPQQVSGWTPVRPGEFFAIELNAQDDDGIEVLEYELDGENATPGAIQTLFEDVPADVQIVVPIPEFGRTTLRYRARDAHGIWSAWQTYAIRSRPVVDLTTNENNAVEFRVGDPEGVGFTYSVSGLPEGVTFSTETGQFAGVVSFDAVDPYSSDPVRASGVHHIVLTETAPGGATSSVDFTWTINHINREPIITNVVAPGLSIQQGQLFELQINGSDPDGDPVIFTVRGTGTGGQDLPQAITIHPETGLISGIFPLDADAGYAIVVGLSECSGVVLDPPCDRPVLPGNHLATLFGFSVAVLDANLPPDILNPGPQTTPEGAAVSLQLQFSDAEGDALTFAAAGLPPGLLVDNNGLISGAVAYESAGPYAVTITVDDHVNAPPRSVTFAWVITHTNRPPVVSIQDRVNIEGDTLLPGASIGTFAFDPDGSPVTFVSAIGLPPGVVMSPTGGLSGSFGFTDAGVYTVTVTVSDGTASTNDSFVWTVHNLNRAPTLTPANQSSREGDVISYQVPAGDPDGNALLFTINGLPPGLTLNGSTGLISGTLPPGSAGVYTVNIGVADDVPVGSLAILRTITWTVGLPVSNQPPVCVAAAASPGLLWPPNHKPVYFSIGGVTDPDGGSPSIKITSILQDEPTNTQGDGNTTQDAAIENNGARAWVRAERMGGENANVYGRVYIIGFTATDASGASCSGTVFIGVPHDQGNHNQPIPSAGRWNSISGALVVAPPPNANADAVTAKKGAAVVVAVQSNDVVYGAVALSIASAPSSGTATVNPNGTVTYTPAANWTGTASFTYRLTNAAGADTAVVSVTVKK